MKNKKGFTLIEVLIVVSIIGLLASIVLASVSAFRSRGRDTRRLADIRQIQGALEFYYSTNGSFPPGTWAQAKTTLEQLSGINKLSNDPSYPAKTYEYATNGSTYVLKATLDGISNPAVNGDIDGTILATINCGSQGAGEVEYCVQP